MSAFTCPAPGCTRGTRERLSRCYLHRDLVGVRRLLAPFSEFFPTRAVRSTSRPSESASKSIYGEPTRFVTYRRGDRVLSRLDGPTVIETRGNGTKTYERWYLDGEMHRGGDLPAQTDYRSDGSVQSEQWYSRGERHRVGAPAWVRFDDDLDAHFEVYYRHGQRHRIDGPAMTTISRNGQVTEQWFLTDVPFPGPETLGQVLAFPEFAPLLPGMIADSSFAPLVAEGYTVEQIAAGISAGVVSLDGIRALANGAPIEWARAFESGAVK